MIPSNLDLSLAESDLFQAFSREKCLSDCLDLVKDKYDYILVDCMPSLGMLTVNALTAADSVIIPVQSQFLAARGMTHLFQSIDLVKKHTNKNLKVEGVVLTLVDEMDLPSIGEKKTVLFALIPDNDTSFNFLVSILYTQLFQQLFYIADHKYNGSLPVPVHFVIDEFANVSLPDDFDKILSVMRSRSVSVSIILQNLAQLKALFEKQWESIVGNCDEFLYLGGNEQSTHKYVSEMLGKSTIDLNTHGKSSGRNGNYSTNYQIGGRELLTPDEVRLLDNNFAILFIRGELPIIDKKYNILNHPKVSYTIDGKEKPYYHGSTNNSIATITIDPNIDNYNYDEVDILENYEIVSSDYIEEYMKIKEDEKTNEQNK